jgi:hypothetical protein
MKQAGERQTIIHFVYFCLHSPQHRRRFRSFSVGLALPGAEAEDMFYQVKPRGEKLPFE